MTISAKTAGAAALNSCLRQPVPQAEEGADFPAFIPALLYFRDPLIREAERVFVGANEVDHRVGCFHQDVFPFWLFVRALTEPKGCQLGGGCVALPPAYLAKSTGFCPQVTHFGKVAA